MNNPEEDSLSTNNLLYYLQQYRKSMKKIIFLLFALIATANLNAQVVEIYENDALIGTYFDCRSHRYKVSFKNSDATATTADANSCELVELYENGTLLQTYQNTTDKTYKVVFRERDYVEIGGVKWATMNVGATTISDAPESCIGDYYAWGEVVPYYKSITYADDTPTINWSDEENGQTHITGKKTGYDWANYCGQETFTEWSSTPYYSSSKNLTLSNDAANYEWGGAWRMPTQKEFIALFKACGVTNTWGSYLLVLSNNTVTKGGIYKISKGEVVDGTTYNVAGTLFVATSDISKRVFFPAASRIEQVNFDTATPTRSYYWTSTLNSSKTTTDFAYHMSTQPKESSSNGYYGPAMITTFGHRCYGEPIRPVR